MSTPRIRAWMFSSATSLGRSAKSGLRAASQAPTAPAIPIVSKPMPRLRASVCASSRECCEEMIDGREMPRTLEGPKASAAITATSAESIPPERATSAFLNPLLCA